MPRSVPEWIGKDDDQAIPRVVKARILLRFKGRCHRTGHKFRAGDVIEFDHIRALCNGGEHRETNLGPILGGKVHRAKTAEDVAERVKTERTRAKHLGYWPKSKRPMKGRGFQPTRGTAWAK